MIGDPVIPKRKPGKISNEMLWQQIVANNKSIDERFQAMHSEITSVKETGKLTYEQSKKTNGRVGILEKTIWLTTGSLVILIPVLGFIYKDYDNFKKEQTTDIAAVIDHNNDIQERNMTNLIKQMIEDNNQKHFIYSNPK